MEWENRVQCLINHVLEKSLYFQERLEELRSINYASKAPPFFIDLLSKINLSTRLTLINEYNSIFLETQDDQIHEALFYKIQSLSGFLTDLYYRLVPPIEFSKTIRNPVSVSLPMERFAKEFAPQANVLIFPDYLYNYTYLDILSNENLGSTYYSKFFPPEVLDKYQKHFILLGFPDALRNNVLSHALIGHEFGHFIAQNYNICSSSQQKVSREYHLDISQEQLKIFLEEYIADIVSIYLFGLASFFASIEFGSSTERFEEISGTHPPLYLRLKNMLDTIDAYNYSQLFSEKYSDKITSQIAEKAKSILNGWKEITTKKEKEVEYSIVGNIFNILKPALEEARQLVKEKIGQRFQLKLSTKIFEYVKNFIEEGIPPSSDLNLTEEHCEPVQLGVILNSAWLYKIWKFGSKRKFNSPQEAIEYARSLDDLSRLTRKAIEQSETIILYHKNKGR